MNLKELFDQLAYGELSQHKYGKSGAIVAEDYPALISHINHGLTALHARFPLQHKDVIIAQTTDQIDYILDVKYAVSNTASTAENKYILDTAEKPFLDDLLRIEAAYDSDDGSITLNDENLSNSWFTPNANTLQIPHAVTGKLATISYRANHARIPLTTTKPELITLDIPQCLESALGSYVASRCYVSLGNQTSAQLSAFYNQMYQSEINQIIRLNLLRESAPNTRTTFTERGWI